jgi:prepilin-type N-terminal cleavage/methylation domain-containing protein
MAAISLAAVPPAPTFRQRGFTLTEMAVVLVIVALLIGGMILPMSTQQNIRHVSETDTSLKNIHEALLGYAAANGRLPCPASGTSNGVESFASGQNAASGECSNFFDGFLPAVTLGIQPTDANGYAIDAWGHRIRYVVSDKTINTVTRTLTRTDGLKSAGMNNVASTPLLAVCTSSTGINPGDTTNPIEYCGTATPLVTSAAAVVLSTGKNDAASGADEQANSTTHDVVFVSHAATPTTATNGEFDDQVIWVSTSILLNRMISAGRLP